MKAGDVNTVTLFQKRIKYISISLLFEPRDLWIGVYWTKEPKTSARFPRWSVYICIIPVLPIRIAGHKGRLAEYEF